MAKIEESTETNFSTETPVDQTAVAVERPVLSVPGAAVGRRKQAIARVRIVPGSGVITVNGRTFEDYFPNKLHQQLVTDPFTVLNLTDAYDVIARISGGGPSGQAGALRLGIARSLNGIDEENNRATLKKAGLKKARKAPQYSKR